MYRRVYIKNLYALWNLNTPQDRNYHCKNCKLTIHRDLNGARNIYLKSLIGELAPEGLL